MAIRTKTCPDCAETVDADARVCRFCGYRFEPKRETPRRVRTKTPASCCGCSCGSSGLIALLAFGVISLSSGLGMVAAVLVSLVAAVIGAQLAHRLAQYPVVIRTLRLPQPEVASSE
jgi:Uncharacterised protein family UPF0547